MDQERVVKCWADYVLYHQGGEQYELVRSGSLVGDQITAKSDQEALKECPKLTKEKGRYLLTPKPD